MGNPPGTRVFATSAIALTSCMPRFGKLLVCIRARLLTCRTTHCRFDPSPHELVSDPMHRQEEMRVIGLRLEFLPQAHDVSIYRAGSRELVISPDFFQQFVPADRLSRMTQKVLQQIELLGREVQGLAFARNLALAYIDFHIAKGVPIFVARQSLRSPKYRLHSRQQFTDRERLG